MSFLIGAGLSLGSSLLGLGSSRKAEAEARKAAEERAQYENMTNLLNWMYQKQLRDFEYNENLRIYDKSKEVYAQQTRFNEDAASRSYGAESRRMDEYLQELAFTKQDLFVDMLKGRGTAEAQGRTGRSAQRMANNVISEYGRNQAILAENLVSRNRQSQEDVTTIGLQKRGADLDAFSRLGLKPNRVPDAPLPLPVPVGGSGGGGSGGIFGIGNALLGAVGAGLSASNAGSRPGLGNIPNYSNAFG
jgi:hypothetical protein